MNERTNERADEQASERNDYAVAVFNTGSDYELVVLLEPGPSGWLARDDAFRRSRAGKSEQGVRCLGGERHTVVRPRTRQGSIS